jgi:hypothetical protein
MKTGIPYPTSSQTLKYRILASISLAAMLSTPLSCIETTELEQEYCVEKKANTSCESKETFRKSLSSLGCKSDTIPGFKSGPNIEIEDGKEQCCYVSVESKTSMNIEFCLASGRPITIEDSIRVASLMRRSDWV